MPMIKCKKMFFHIFDNMFYLFKDTKHNLRTELEKLKFSSIFKFIYHTNLYSNKDNKKYINHL